MSMRSCETCPYHLSSLSTAKEKRHRVWYVPVAPLVFEMNHFWKSLIRYPCYTSAYVPVEPVSYPRFSQQECRHSASVPSFALAKQHWRGSGGTTLLISLSFVI